MDLEIKKLLAKNHLTYDDLKGLTDNLFAIKKQELGLTNINLKYSKNKLRPYGSVGFNGDLNNISIYINLHKILNEKQDNVIKFLIYIIILYMNLNMLKHLIKQKMNNIMILNN
jgi:hypothetical protein